MGVGADDPGGARVVVTLDGDDVSDEIRGQQVTVAVTPVSANPAVVEAYMGSANVELQGAH